MAPVKNGQLIFNEIPETYPVPGRTTKYIEKDLDPDTVPLDGGFLVKVLALSSDPYLRGRMRDPSVKSYMPAFKLGEPIEAHGVGRVLRSDNPDFKVGDHVVGVMPFEKYTVVHDASDFMAVDNSENLNWSTFIGAAGMPGQTAYYGWKEYAEAKKGDTCFVSTGAGAVGSIVVQLAKMDGLKVIASAGSDDKVAYIKELGADVAFNYKTTNTEEVLAREGPIQVYWDNVGGRTLQAAIEHADIGARFVECGMISGYNEDENPPKNLMMIVGKSLRLSGFLVARLHPKYREEFYRTMPRLLASGKIKFREDITKGLENGGDALLAVQKGVNVGKAVILVAED